MKNEALAVCRRRQRPIQPSFTPVFTPPLLPMATTTTARIRTVFNVVDAAKSAKTGEIEMTRLGETLEKCVVTTNAFKTIIEDKLTTDAARALLRPLASASFMRMLSKCGMLDQYYMRCYTCMECAATFEAKRASMMEGWSRARTEVLVPMYGAPEPTKKHRHTNPVSPSKAARYELDTSVSFVTDAASVRSTFNVLATASAGVDTKGLVPMLLIQVRDQEHDALVFFALPLANKWLFMALQTVFSHYKPTSKDQAQCIAALNEAFSSDPTGLAEAIGFAWSTIKTHKPKWIQAMQAASARSDSRRDKKRSREEEEEPVEGSGEENEERPAKRARKLSTPPTSSSTTPSSSEAELAPAEAIARRITEIIAARTWDEIADEMMPDKTFIDPLFQRAVKSLAIHQQAEAWVAKTTVEHAAIEAKAQQLLKLVKRPDPQGAWYSEAERIVRSLAKDHFNASKATQTIHAEALELMNTSKHSAMASIKAALHLFLRTITNANDPLVLAAIATACRQLEGKMQCDACGCPVIAPTETSVLGNRCYFCQRSAYLERYTEEPKELEVPKALEDKEDKEAEADAEEEEEEEEEGEEEEEESSSSSSSSSMEVDTPQPPATPNFDLPVPSATAHAQAEADADVNLDGNHFY